MKNARQAAILNLIETRTIDTQEELAIALCNEGFNVTQATVSRDIKEMRLMKVLTPEGGYKYASNDKEDTGISDRLGRIFADSVLSVTAAENLIVLNTIAGGANAAGEAIDSLHLPQIIGTICGDNTIFTATKTKEDAQIVAQKLQLMMRK